MSLDVVKGEGRCLSAPYRLSRHHCREQGAALLIFALVLVIGVAAYFLPASVFRSREPEDRITAEALAKAKQALLGYAASYPDTHGGARGPGFLPCPDTDDDGYSNPPCNTGGQLTLGRLPWRELEVGDLRDGAGERLWYAVSSNYRETPPVASLQSDTAVAPFFTLDNGGPQLAAVILAPGRPLTGQSRPASLPGDYLEGVNASTVYADPKRFRNYPAADGNANDRAVGIRRDELAARMERRALAEAARLLKGYDAACGYLPWAAPFDPTAPAQRAVAGLAEGALPTDAAAAGPPSVTVEWGSACAFGVTPAVTGWLTAEGWQRLLYYAAAPGWLEGGSRACGSCLVLNGVGGIPALLVSAGRALSGGRPSPLPARYFEGENATPGDGRFESRTLSAAFNDQVEALTLP